MTTKKLTIATLMLTTAHIATANANTEGFYLGGEFGNTNLKIADLSIDDREKSYGLYTGYQFNHWFALEGKISKAGDYHLSEDLIFVSIDEHNHSSYSTAHAQWEISTTTYSFAPKFTLQLNDVLSVYSKLGLNYTKVSGDGNITTLDDKYFVKYYFDNTKGWGYTFAVGFNASLNKHLALRLGYDYAETDLKNNYGTKLKTKLSQFSVGLNYTF
ncbi:porin family protein [uncultured Shewanella sp.]|uniref:porin family protein n=1 Tax=uncultured Shewanella sp. TaxID=173975 RepID=UPI00261B7F38|nr:porin family protein [uncultured Shewanella sp.]